MIKEYSFTNEQLNEYIDEKYIVLISVKTADYAEAIFYTNNRDEAVDFAKSITFEDGKEFEIAKGKRSFYISAGLNPAHPKFSKGDKNKFLIPIIKITKEKSEVDGETWYKSL